MFASRAFQHLKTLIFALSLSLSHSPLPHLHIMPENQYRSCLDLSLLSPIIFFTCFLECGDLVRFFNVSTNSGNQGSSLLIQRQHSECLDDASAPQKKWRKQIVYLNVWMSQAWLQDLKKWRCDNEKWKELHLIVSTCEHHWMNHASVSLCISIYVWIAAWPQLLHSVWRDEDWSKTGKPTIASENKAAQTLVTQNSWCVRESCRASFF